MPDVQAIAPDDPRAVALIAELDALQRSLYAEDSNHLDSTAELRKPNVHFLGVLEDEVLLGCGAVKLLEDPLDKVRYGEIKRMYVSPHARGKGIAKMLMRAL